MPVKPKLISLEELNVQISDAIRSAAAKPTIFAYKPQDHQLPFHESNKIGRLFLGGNRAGKTVSGGSELVAAMTGVPINGITQKFKPPVRCRAIGVDYDNGVDKIIIPEIKRWMPSSYLINGSWDDSYRKSNRTLTLTNGSTSWS